MLYGTRPSSVNGIAYSTGSKPEPYDFCDLGRKVGTIKGGLHLLKAARPSPFGLLALNMDQEIIFLEPWLEGCVFADELWIEVFNALKQYGNCAQFVVTFSS